MLHHSFTNWLKKMVEAPLPYSRTKLEFLRSTHSILTAGGSIRIFLKYSIIRLFCVSLICAELSCISQDFLYLLCSFWNVLYASKQSVSLLVFLILPTELAWLVQLKQYNKLARIWRLSTVLNPQYVLHLILNTASLLYSAVAFSGLLWLPLVMYQ